MIEKYMVERGNKTIGYASTKEEAIGIIGRYWKLKDKAEYRVRDLLGDSIVDISAEMQAMKKEAKAKKRRPSAGLKTKKGDVIDNKYTAWLGKQPCVVTGQLAPRGAGPDDMHCHHIHGRARGRNDHQQVPLIGIAHSWGLKSYHSCARSAYGNYWDLPAEVIDFFEQKAKELRTKYISETVGK